MQVYNAYFLARGDEVIGKRCFEAANGHTAKARAEEFCRDHPGCIAVEIWGLGWPLYRYPHAASESAALRPVGRQL